MIITYTALYQYIFIYLSIIMTGSLRYQQNQDVFLIAGLVLSVYCISQGRIEGWKRHRNFLVLLGIAFLITALMTFFKLEISSVANIYSQLLVAMCAVCICREMFLTRFLKIIYLISGLSIVAWAISQIGGYGIAARIFPVIQGVVSNAGVSYGGYLIMFSKAPRNVGLFGEPGIYQIVLTIALCFALFFYDKYEMKHKRLMIASITAAIITAQSTTGYLTLIAIFVFYLFSRKETDESKKGGYFVNLIVLVVFALVSFAYITGEGFIADNLFGKILDSSGEINLSGSSGGARTISMQTDLRMVLDSPFGRGYQTYLSEFPSFKVQQMLDDQSSCGLTRYMAIYGVHVVLLTLGYVINGYLRLSRDKFVFMALLITYMFAVFSQINLYFSMLYLPMFYGFIFQNGESGESL